MQRNPTARPTVTFLMNADPDGAEKRASDPPPKTPPIPAPFPDWTRMTMMRITQISTWSKRISPYMS